MPTVKPIGVDNTILSTFTVCTYERKSKKDGSPIDIKTWHKIRSYTGKHAETLGEVAKGTWVVVEGKMAKDSWINTEGVKQYSNFIDITRGDLQVVASGQGIEEGHDAVENVAQN